MKFTIAICTYNGERTLKLAVDALLNLNEFDYLVEEVLLIDNASTDSTRQICEDYCKKNSKLHYIYEEKAGLSNARRCAVNTKGDWVIYVDDDNILCGWWLTGLKDIIENHPDVGVVNGAVIAVPTEDLSQEEEIRLEMMKRHLACTHVRSIEYNAGENTEPMGAGMCVLASALREVDKQGWLLLSGRTGNNMASGEDTELCHKVFSLGYRYVCSYNIQLNHLIPKSRLTEEYTASLLIGLTKSRYAYISQKSNYIIERMMRCLKYMIIRIRILDRLGREIDPVEKEKNIEQKIIADTFLHCAKEDKLIKR